MKKKLAITKRMYCPQNEKILKLIINIETNNFTYAVQKKITY